MLAWPHSAGPGFPVRTAGRTAGRTTREAHRRSGDGADCTGPRCSGRQRVGLRSAWRSDAWRGTRPQASRRRVRPSRDRQHRHAGPLRDARRDACIARPDHTRAKWRALVRVVDDIGRATWRCRVGPRVDHEAGRPRVPHAPAHDAPTDDIEDHGEGQEAGHRGDVGEVSDPAMVRRGRAKGPVDEVRSRRGLGCLPPWPRGPAVLRDVRQDDIALRSWRRRALPPGVAPAL